MPSEPDPHGVFIEEIPGPPSITGVPTSVCAFVGRAARGPVDTPVEIHNFAQFHDRFGGLWADGLLGFAVRDFFTNGGSTAVVVRLVDASAGRAVLRHGPLTLMAADPGTWGNRLRIRIDHNASPPPADPSQPSLLLFNLTVHDDGTGATEEHRDVTVGIAGSGRDLGVVLASESNLLRLMAPAPGAMISRPEAHAAPAAGQSPWVSDTTSTGVGDDPADRGADGGPLTRTGLLGGVAGANRTGLYALDDADLFNLLIIPPDPPAEDLDPVVVGAAHAYCQKRRAILLLDGPAAWGAAADLVAATDAGGLGAIGANAAVYFPRIRAANPLHADQVESFPAAGAVAGVLARTDGKHGVWKAPAGRESTLIGASALTRTLTTDETGGLTRLGVNCLRDLPLVGPVVWGARTAAGADAAGSEWKYLPVRRTALFISESLDRGTRWVVFEPNGEPLWAALRTTVGDFLYSLFRAGAFQGATAREAYFVRCDRSTTTQADIDRGVVNMIVGFAPLKPAEFVILGLRQSTATPGRSPPFQGTGKRCLP